MSERKYTLAEANRIRQEIIDDMASLMYVAFVDVRDVRPEMELPLDESVFATEVPITDETARRTYGSHKTTPFCEAFAEMLYERIQHQDTDFYFTYKEEK